jgi:putative peptide zinc metalloprotease protein
MSGKTFSESWHRVAGLRARLRPQVRVHRQYFRGERWYLLHDPFNNQFFRLRPAAYAFVLRLGADRTVGAAWHATLEEFPEEAPGQQDVVELLSQLYASNLLLADAPADTAALFHRYRKRRQREATAKFLGAMFARFPLFDPDGVLNRLKPVSDRIFSRWGFLLWLVVVGGGLAAVLGSTGELVAQSRRVLDPVNLPWLLLVTAVLKAFHEFGHMALCKKFGGSVHRAGILLMIFTPMPFADTTAAWGFRSRGQRLLVGAGGMLVELFLAALAALLWVNAGPGLARDLAFNAMLVGSVSTLLFNLNPLLRFDGYYLLADLLGVANLYQRSLKLLRYLCERHLFGLRRERSPAADRGEAWILGLYGVFGALYRFFLFASILLFVWDRYLLLGVVMGGICLIAWILVPLGKLLNYLAGSPKLHLQRGRALAVVLGLALALGGLVRWLPLPQAVRAPGVLEAREASFVANATGGRITELFVAPGEAVEAGAPLLRLEDPSLSFALREVGAQLEEGRARLRQALAENPASRPVLEGYVAALTERAAELEARRQALVVRAPHAGWWLAPGLEDRLGSWLPRGTAIGQVIDPAAFEFKVRVPAARIPRLVPAVESPAVVRLDGQPWTRLPVTTRVLVAASPEALESRERAPAGEAETAPAFEFRGRVEPTADAVLLHGLAGQVRFSLPPQSLGRQAARWWREFFEQRGEGGW